MIRQAIATLAASLELWATELRTGTRLIEAVETDTLNTELLAATGSKEAAADVRQMAIDLAKLGIRNDDLLPMASLYHIARALDIDAEDIRKLAHARNRGNA